MNSDKLIQFASDHPMKDSVYNVLVACFLKKRGEEDVHTKAARFIAVELLQEAWRVIENHNSQKKENRLDSNVGL